MNLTSDRTNIKQSKTYPLITSAFQFREMAASIVIVIEGILGVWHSSIEQIIYFKFLLKNLTWVYLKTTTQKCFFF